MFFEENCSASASVNEYVSWSEETLFSFLSRITCSVK